jgi:hypothetical protein
MIDRKKRTKPETSSTFTSWKLDISNAANADKELKPAPLRFFQRVLSAMDEETWKTDTCEARIGDDAIADEVPGCRNRHTIQDHRNALQEIGWLTFKPGSGRTATAYLISDRRVNPILDKLAELRDARSKRREVERQSYRDGGKRSHPVVKIPPVFTLEDHLTTLLYRCRI